jgi:Flp pilus assembly secretin CpaC
MRRVSQALITVFAAVIATGANAAGTTPGTQSPALRTSAGKPAAVAVAQKPMLRTTTIVKVPVAVAAPKIRVATPVAAAPKIRVAAPVAIMHPAKPVRVAVAVHRPHVVKKRVAVRRYSPAISLPMDEVRVVAFTQPIATIFVGNPLIADVSMIDNRHAFVLGKSFGATNIVALNSDGRQVVNQSVSVFGHTGNLVVLHRGVAQATLTCASSRCEPLPTPGDDKDSYGTRMEQIASHQDANMKAAAAGK